MDISRQMKENQGGRKGKSCGIKKRGKSRQKGERIKKQKGGGEGWEKKERKGKRKARGY